MDEKDDKSPVSEPDAAESIAWVDIPEQDAPPDMPKLPDEAATDEANADDAKAAAEARAEEIRRRREEIQRYIDSLENAEAFDNGSYAVHLDYFEGPLDLLLFLVKRSKIGIEEIFVSKITEQYIAMMEQIEDLDLDRASDFIEVAACLLEIKAKALLPKPQEELPDDEDPAKLLIRKLEEYKLYKEASAKLKEYETVGLHYRPPDKSVGKPRFVLSEMNKDGLLAALQKMFIKLEQRAEMNKQRSIARDRFTVAEKILQIMESFEEIEQLSFFDLFDADYNKSEIISTFQAMLELLKNQFFTAEQNDTFGDIILRKVIRAKGEQTDDTY